MVRQRYLDCGAVEAVVVDARDEFADEYCLLAITSNALGMDRYPLVSALAAADRQAPAQAARDHGGTGSSRTAAPARATTRCGSRSPFATLAPDLDVLAPVRDYADPGEGDRVRRRRTPSRSTSPRSRRSRSTRTCGPRRRNRLPRRPVEPHQDVYD